MRRPRRSAAACCGAVLAAALLMPAQAGEPASSEVETVVARINRVFGYHRASTATPAEIELGRLLFMDARLSANGKMSCATCHRPDLNYGDGLPRAIGRDGKAVARNTPSLLTAAYHADLFWDGRAANVEEAALVAAQNPAEMNQPLPALVRKVRSLPEYAKPFEAAYPGVPISSTTIGRALGAFVLAVAAPEDSPFDRFLKDRSGLSPEAVRGLLVFAGKGGCTNCHASSQLTYNQRYQNIGLAAGEPEDPGRYLVEPRVELWGAFRIPSLRDVALTAPYMHDGRFKTLEEVVDFYDRGGEDTRYQDSAIAPLGLSAQDKKDLVAFLFSLTSSTGAGAGFVAR